MGTPTDQEGYEVEIAGLNKMLRFLIRDNVSVNTFIARCMGSFGIPPTPTGENSIGWHLTPMDNIKITSRPDQDPAGTITLSVYRPNPNELDEALVGLVEALFPEALEWIQKRGKPSKEGRYLTEGDITYMPGHEPDEEPDPDNIEV
tara:strand:+ start:540 stop:980 length:441 start_codon:yes stop_codon:yes gene_type:complete